MAPKRKEPSLGQSPVVGRGRRAAVDTSVFNEEDTMSSMHSTINAEKFDDARFSEIRQMENESHPLRIIIFVVIVILIGGGGVLFFKNLVSNDQANTTTNNTTDDNEVVQEDKSSYVINTSPIKDSQAVNAPKNSEYDESALITVGESTDTKGDLTRILYSRFQTFGRLTFDFTTADKKLPKTTINFESTANRMIVSFQGVSTINNGLKLDQMVSDIVKEVRYNAADNSYIILFEEKTKYVPVKDGDNLILNFKTVDELNNPTVEETPTTTPEPTDDEEEPTTPTTTTTDTSKPAAMHTDNEYSQSKQYVSSNVSTNKIAHDVYYFDNYVNSYQFSWAQKNAIGDEYVPNAVAYYDTTAPTGKIYLNVEISNISQEIFDRNGVDELSLADIEAKTGVTTSGSNLKKIELLSYENGVAKYRFELNTKTDFKLWVDKTVDNTTGTISVTIKN